MSAMYNTQRAKLNAYLAALSVEDLRGMAKDLISTPAEKGRATWHANRKAGTVSTNPTPKQLRARLLNQISFYLKGINGQLSNVIQQAHSIAGKSDMSKDQETQLWCALRLASVTTKDVMLIAARINKENKEKKHEQL